MISSVVLLSLPLVWLVGSDSYAVSSVPEAGALEQTQPVYETHVRASRRHDEPGVQTLRPDDPMPHLATSLADRLEGLNGVSLQRRGPSGVEPVVRGLGWERVQTKAGIVPLYGACPGRMDPPANYVSPVAFTEVQVVKGLPSVTLGPPSSGASLVIDVDYKHRYGIDPDVSGWIQTAADSARKGSTTQAVVQGGTERLDYRAAAEVVDLNSYESASGVKVPGNKQALGATAVVGYEPTVRQRMFVSMNFAREQNVAYPALPMNMDDSMQLSVNGGYSWRLGTEMLRAVDLTGGAAYVDHLMSNDKKPNRAMLIAETESSVYSYAAQAKLRLALGATRLDVGADTYRAGRDAERSRTMTAHAMTTQDRLWPDALQWGAGVFAESRWSLRNVLKLRIGARADHVSSSARASQASSLGGKTVAEQYVDFYGNAARDTDRHEFFGSANALIEWSVMRGLTVHAGVGTSARPANTTERYYAFAPAPGGYLVGNPALEAERKAEAELGLDIDLDTVRLRAVGFYSGFRDFITATAIDKRDVNGDGLDDMIRGYQNVDARLLGSELAVTLQPLGWLTVPAQLTYVRATNLDRDAPLPEIPPLTGDAAVRVDVTLPVPTWIEVGARFSAAQNRIDETFPENSTPGFVVARVRVACELLEQVHVSFGVENLFNEEYNEHLAREAVLPAGDLMAGDEIPAPGRSFFATVRVDT